MNDHPVTIGTAAGAILARYATTFLKAMAVASALAIVSTTSAFAWWDEGHMRVAAIAYELLTPAAKTEASRLIKLNPNYAEWVAAIPQPPDGSPRDVDRYTFIRAAVWADDIKLIKAYRDASKKDGPDTPTAGQNIGYADKLIHAYWHYKDLAFSPDASPLGAPDAVNAATQIKLFEAALPKSAGQSDDIRSYDLVWLLHLVGDAHQPLHAVSMFRADLSVEHQMDNEPDTGDRGGNEITVVPANGQPVSLHAYWDGLFGGYSTPFGAVFDTFGGNPKKDGSGRYIPNILWATGAEASITDPEVWFSESFEVAKATAYADPVLSGPDPILLTRQYETNAMRAARSQLALAAARLAKILNDAFTD